MGTRYTPQDTMYALGYYVPDQQAHIDIQFLPNLEGYIWFFHAAIICRLGSAGRANGSVPEGAP